MQFLFLNNAAKKESKIYSLVRFVPLLSKLIENLIKDRMAEQLDKYNLIETQASMAPVRGERVEEKEISLLSPSTGTFLQAHTKWGGRGKERE